jgi:hypothetical protein
LVSVMESWDDSWERGGNSDVGIRELPAPDERELLVRERDEGAWLCGV